MLSMTALTLEFDPDACAKFVEGFQSKVRIEVSTGRGDCGGASIPVIIAGFA